MSSYTLEMQKMLQWYSSRLENLLQKQEKEKFCSLLAKGLKKGYLIDYRKNFINRNMLESALSVNWDNPADGDEVVDFLLDHGADVNSRDSVGWNALEYACLSQWNVSANSFEKIIERTDDLEQTGKDAIRFIITRYLQSERFDNSQLLSVVYGRRNELLSRIKLLLDAGVVIDDVGEAEDYVPKHWATPAVKEVFDDIKKYISFYYEQQEQAEKSAATYYDYEL